MKHKYYPLRGLIFLSSKYFIIMTTENRPLMGDSSWTVKSSHTDSPKALMITFEIPKDKYKGSNTSQNDRLLRAKTTWLREQGCKAWTEAIKNEFGIEAIEPDSNALKKSTTSLTPTEQKAYDAFSEQRAIVDAIRLQMTAITRTIQQGKESKAKEKRNSTEWKRISEKIKSLDTELKELKQKLRLESKLLTKTKNTWERTRSRQNARRATADRKEYLKAKAKLNENLLLFPGQVELLIQSNIVTGHDFDAPNCWPSVKPLQDGGTDTCVLWHDDNNRWIKRTTFYGGGKDPDCYVIRMIVREWNGNEDPFGESQED